MSNRTEPYDTTNGKQSASGHSRISALSFRWWKEIAEALVNGFLRIDAFGLSKQVAFSVVFALLPTLFVLMSVAALAERYLGVPVTAELREQIVARAPADTQDFLLDLVDAAIADTSATTLSIGGLVALALALWAGMSGINTLVEAVNRAYGLRNTRPWPVKRLISLIMLVALTGTVVISVIATFFGERTVDEVQKRTGEPHWLDRFGEVGQVVFAISALFFALLLLYRYSPSVVAMWRWVLPGAVFTTFAWLVLLQATGFIARRLDFASVYGAASGFMLLLYVLNFAGVIVIVGALINGILGDRYDTTRNHTLKEHPERERYVSSGQEVMPPPFQIPIPARFRRRD